MTPILILLGFIAVLVAGYFVAVRRHRSHYLATVEYWVYIPSEESPKQETAMTRMIGKNPYAKSGYSPIGPGEGLIFSDIRLRISLVRRAANPNLFRPDLFADVETDAEHLALLNEAKAAIKIRYLSEEPLKNKRHIQFGIHAAAAYADLAQGELIYDAVSQRLFDRRELDAMLSQSVDATKPEFHVRVLWKPAPNGGFAETLGMRKVGRKDLKSDLVEADQRLLLSSVLQEAAFKIWADPNNVKPIEVDAYDDRFEVLFEPSKSDPVPVRILRIQKT